jgi:uncharacterized OB-fold protein
MPSCPFCGSADAPSSDVSGHGTVYSWVTVHVALDPDFEDEVPYTVLTVELAEDRGARVVGRLIGAPGPALASAARRSRPSTSRRRASWRGITTWSSPAASSP